MALHQKLMPTMVLDVLLGVYVGERIPALLLKLACWELSLAVWCLCSIGIPKKKRKSPHIGPLRRVLEYYQALLL